jgi:hypothetical protein
MAAGILLTVGSLILLQVPAAPSRPTPEPAQSTSAASAPALSPPSSVHLQLRGLPANAFVTLDGEPASSTLTLSRSEHPYDLSVTAPGKVAWHIHYVPRADEALNVSLRDEPAPPPPPAAAPPKRTVPRKKHKPKSPGPLRVPDF